MLFASFEYILLFLPIVVVGSIVLRKLFGATHGPRATQFFILAASIYFYSNRRPLNLVYLSFSIVGNWLLARGIDRAQGASKKRILIAGNVLNVAYLCLFKYLAFFASMLAFALPSGYKVPALGFPLGISFFTITQIMYLMECYEGLITPGTLFDHATFVTFFPYLISGPLVRAKRILHQFGSFGGKDETRFTTLARGVFHFSIGLFKKAVFADAFARVAAYGFSTAQHPSALESWVFGLAYMLQVYFDFSGYSDMAIGSAMMLGIEIPRNFDAPFRATSIIEFWQRWHISLTTFITTYLYTPILKALPKRTLMFSALSTLLAMGIAGLWHGPAWTFVIFGLLHGSYLAINQVWRKKQMPHIPGFFSWMLTIALVMIAFIYFGSDSVVHATARTIALFNPHHPFTTTNLALLNIEGLSLHIFGPPLVIGTLVAFIGPSSEQLARDFRPTALNCAYAVVLTLIGFVFVNSSIPAPFVYFRF